MLSVILLEQDKRDSTLRPEVIVRSLSWLVSAVVSGAVRDVVLTASGTTDLKEIADVTGCEFVQADREAERLRSGAQMARSQLIMVILAGYAADPALVEELDQLERSGAWRSGAYVVRTSQSFMDSLRPLASRTVAVVVSREQCSTATSFKDLVRASRKGARLLTQLRPVG